MFPVFSDLQCLVHVNRGQFDKYGKLSYSVSFNFCFIGFPYRPTPLVSSEVVETFSANTPADTSVRVRMCACDTGYTPQRELCSGTVHGSLLMPPGSPLHCLPPSVLTVMI